MSLTPPEAEQEDASHTMVGEDDDEPTPIAPEKTPPAPPPLPKPSPQPSREQVHSHIPEAQVSTEGSDSELGRSTDSFAQSHIAEFLTTPFQVLNEDEMTTDSPTALMASGNPVALEVLFHNVLFEGQFARMKVNIKNQSEHDLNKFVLTLESPGLAKRQMYHVKTIPKLRECGLNLQIPLGPAGKFSVFFILRYVSKRGIRGYMGKGVIRINPIPETEKVSVFSLAFPNINPSEDDNTAWMRRTKNLPDRYKELLEHDLKGAFQTVSLSKEFEVSPHVCNSLAQKPPFLLINQDCKDFAYWEKAIDLVPSKTAQQAGVKPIRLVGRTMFFMGKSGEMADLITAFSETNDPNNAQINRSISRVHVTAMIHGDGILLVDGSPQKQPSKKGSNFSGQRLPQWKPEAFDPSTDAIPLQSRGCIKLIKGGGQYAFGIDTVYFPPARPGQPNISNYQTWTGKDKAEALADPGHAQEGALRFTVELMENEVNVGIWIFSSASFGTSEFNPIQLPNLENDLDEATNVTEATMSYFGTASGLAQIQGCFRNYRGCFWLENFIDNDQVRIGQFKVAKDQIVPLYHGAQLTLGGIEFTALKPSRAGG